jgi:hypothetical protein
MFKALISVCIIGLLATPCVAQARWCALLGHSPRNTIVFPPIARVANVQGVVIARLHFSVSGQVASVETISGPKLLAQSVGEQLQTWTVKTDAPGNEPCQALFIAEFTIDKEHSALERPPASDIFYVWINAITVILDTSSMASTSS